MPNDTKEYAESLCLEIEDALTAARGTIALASEDTERFKEICRNLESALALIVSTHDLAD
jgi:hypothetical protein